MSRAWERHPARVRATWNKDRTGGGCGVSSPEDPTGCTHLGAAPRWSPPPKGEGDRAARWRGPLPHHHPSGGPPPPKGAETKLARQRCVHPVERIGGGGPRDPRVEEPGGGGGGGRAVSLRRSCPFFRQTGPETSGRRDDRTAPTTALRAVPRPQRGRRHPRPRPAPNARSPAEPGFLVVGGRDWTIRNRVRRATAPRTSSDPWRRRPAEPWRPD